MTTWSTGSVANHVGNMIGWGNVPASISGTVLITMADQEVNFVNTLTNAGLVTTGFEEKYQPALIDLTYSRLLVSIEAQQGGVDSVKLGELAISQGNSSNSDLAKQLRDDATRRLIELGRSVRYARIVGGT